MSSYIHVPQGDSEGSDLELGSQRRSRRKRPFSLRRLGSKMLRYLPLQVRSKVRPAVVGVSALIGIFILIFLFKGRELRGLADKDARRLSRSDLSGNSHLYGHLKNLVMVAGHSVYTSKTCGQAEGEDSWYLESYQQHSSQAATFVEHIKVGVQVAAEDQSSLLLFSGGETRKEAGPRSEAQSYWSVAEAKDWFGSGMQVRDRALTEEHARDSFENLLFSVCRFRELTGAYPMNITVVSYEFKEFRFANLHRSAVRFPAARFAFRGTPSAPTSVLAALQGEQLVRESFERDPYGCQGDLLEKRLRRDPFSRTVPYPTGCPEISGLFSYCGSELYSKRLPWDNW